MPILIQWILGLAALVASIATIWTKLVKPIADLIILHNRLIPMLTDLLKEFENSPGAFSVLGEIAQQFRTDSGSSLRDAVNRIEASAADAHAAAEQLKIGVETARQLAKIDRDHLGQLMILLDRVATLQKSATIERAEIKQAIDDKNGDT